LSTTVSVTENVTTVSSSTSSVAVTVSPLTTEVTLSVGPITIGGGGNTFTEGAGAPSSTPNVKGDFYKNTSTDQIYLAIGTASSSDWIEILRNY
jgi:hypothetical protein